MEVKIYVPMSFFDIKMFFKPNSSRIFIISFFHRISKCFANLHLYLFEIQIQNKYSVFQICFVIDVKTFHLYTFLPKYSF